MIRPDARPPRHAPRRARPRVGLRVGALAATLAVAAPAAADGWEVRAQEDPFAGTLVTSASSAGDERGSRLAVECIEGDGTRRLRLRLTDAAVVDGAGAAAPATEVLFRVDAGDTVAFRPPDVTPSTGVGGGLLIDPGRRDARTGELVAALGTGERAWVKVLTSGRDYLHAYVLDGAGEALEAPVSACDGAARGERAAPAALAVPPAVPASPAAVATAGPAPSIAALAASIPPDAMAAAEASLPSGLTMDGLVGHLGTVISSIEAALGTAASGRTPGAGLEALRDADEELENFRSLFRRLPAAAKAPLSGLVTASTGRLRTLSDSALARPGSGAVLGPAVAPIFEALATLEN